MWPDNALEIDFAAMRRRLQAPTEAPVRVSLSFHSRIQGVVAVAFVGGFVEGIPSKGLLPVGKGGNRNKALEHALFPMKIVTASNLFVRSNKKAKARIVNVQPIREVFQRQWLAATSTTMRSLLLLFSTPHGFLAQEQHFRHGFVEMFPVLAIDVVQRRMVQIGCGGWDVRKAVGRLGQGILRVPGGVEGASHDHYYR